MGGFSLLLHTRAQCHASVRTFCENQITRLFCCCTELTLPGCNCRVHKVLITSVLLRTVCSWINVGAATDSPQWARCVLCSGVCWLLQRGSRAKQSGVSLKTLENKTVFLNKILTLDQIIWWKQKCNIIFPPSSAQQRFPWNSAGLRESDENYCFMSNTIRSDELSHRCEEQMFITSSSFLIRCILTSVSFITNCLILF